MESRLQIHLKIVLLQAKSLIVKWQLFLPISMFQYFSFVFSSRKNSERSPFESNFINLSVYHKTQKLHFLSNSFWLKSDKVLLGFLVTERENRAVFHFLKFCHIAMPGKI